MNKKTVGSLKACVYSFVFVNLTMLAFLAPTQASAQSNRLPNKVFHSDALYLKSIALNQPIQTFTLGDFNGDGKTDIAVLERNKRNISLYLAKSPFEFHQQKRIKFKHPITDIKAKDFNHDNIQDLILLFEKNNTLASYLVSSNGRLRLKGYAVTKQAGKSIELVTLDKDIFVLVRCERFGIERYAVLKKGLFKYKGLILDRYRFEDIKPMRDGCEGEINVSALCMGSNTEDIGIVRSDENNMVEGVNFQLSNSERAYLLEELNEDLIPELIIGSENTSSPNSSVLIVKQDFGVEIGQKDRTIYTGGLPDELFPASFNHATKDLILLWKKKQLLTILYDPYSAKNTHTLTLGLPDKMESLKVCDLDSDERSEILVQSQDGKSLYIITPTQSVWETMKGKMFGNTVQFKLPLFSKPDNLAVFQTKTFRNIVVSHLNSSILSVFQSTNDKVQTGQIELGFTPTQVRFLSQNMVLCISTSDKKMKLLEFNSSYNSYQEYEEPLIGLNFFEEGILNRYRNSFLLTLLDRGNKNVQPRVLHTLVKPRRKKKFINLLPGKVQLMSGNSEFKVGEFGFFEIEPSKGKMNYLALNYRANKQNEVEIKTSSLPYSENGKNKMLLAGDFDYDSKDDIIFKQNSELWVSLFKNKYDKKKIANLEENSKDDYIKVYSDSQQKYVLGFQSDNRPGFLQCWLLDIKHLKTKPLAKLGGKNIYRAVYLDEFKPHRLYYLNQESASLDILDFLN